MSLCRIMTMTFRLLGLVLFSVLMAGCQSTITNLTPTKQSRNSTGLYPVEVAWTTRQQTVRPQTLQPYVMVEFESYPMRRTLGMTNRWETVIPVPPGKNSVGYYFRFNYEYNRFGAPGQDSKLSRGYRLDILDK